MAIITPTSVTGSATTSIGPTGTVTFSNMTSTAGFVLNGIFSSTYDNYLLVVQGTATSGGGVSATLYNGASAESGSVYYRQRWVIDGNTPSIINYAAESPWASVLALTTNVSQSFMYISRPNEPAPTAFYAMNAYAPPTSAYWYEMAGFCYTTTQYTGLAFRSETGSITMAGKITVYGFVK